MLGRAGLIAIGVMAPAVAPQAAVDSPVALERGQPLPPLILMERAAPGPLLPLGPEIERDLRLHVSLLPELMAGPVASLTQANLPAMPTESVLEVGGFVSYRLDEMLFTGEARAGGGATAADLTATYRPHSILGGNTSFRISIGAEWAERDSGAAFEPGGGITVASEGEGGTRADYNVSFSVSHALLPGLYLSGLAAAAHSPEPHDGPHESQSHFLFGAGLGLRF